MTSSSEASKTMDGESTDRYSNITWTAMNKHGRASTTKPQPVIRHQTFYHLTNRADLSAHLAMFRQFAPQNNEYHPRRAQNQRGLHSSSRRCSVLLQVHRCFGTKAPARTEQ